MVAPKGNQFWKQRSSHGNKPIFENPEKLWEASCEYFEWVDLNPLYSSETVKFQGAASLTEVPKMRAMTVTGMCLFLGITYQSWSNYCSNKDFFEVTSRIRSIIDTQKFEGAAADLLNPNIIARDLGLSDKQSLEHSGRGGGPIENKWIIEFVDAKNADS